MKGKYINFKYWLSIILIMLFIGSFGTVNFSYAKPRGGSRGNRGGGGWGNSRTTTTKKSTTKKEVKKTKQGSGWGSGKKDTKPATAKKPKLSKTERKRKEAAAKKKGTSFKSKKAAQEKFKKDHAKKYSATYKSKPATRPGHIPQTTNVGGQNININYNSTYGGYGYMSGGRWMLYDAMRDIVMMNMLMSQNNYVVIRDDGVCFISHLSNRFIYCFISSLEK